MKQLFSKKKRERKKKLVALFPLCHGNGVPRHGGEENLICLDILLSNPPFPPPSEAFSKPTPTFLFIRAENPTCAAFLISSGHIKGCCSKHRP